MFFTLGFGQSDCTRRRSFLIDALLLAAGGFGLWMFLKRRLNRVSEEQGLAAADARLAEAKAAVDTARAAMDDTKEHLKDLVSDEPIGVLVTVEAVPLATAAT